MKNLMEKSPAPALTREQIMGILSKFVKKPIVVDEKFDEKGLRLLEVKVGDKKPDEIPGEYTEFLFTRGEDQANIDVEYFRDGVLIGAGPVADYKSGVWNWDVN